MMKDVLEEKINRQLQGKLIRHFSKASGLLCVIWGGQFNSKLSNIITFFCSVNRIE